MYGSFELGNILSFQKWKQGIVGNIQNIFAENPNWHSVGFLNDHLLKAHPSVQFCDGEGYVFRYGWPNGEEKYVNVIHKVIACCDDFWIRKYPFATPLGNSDKFTINPNAIHNPTEAVLVKDTSIIPSHNMHFGHFVADDLPWLAITAANESYPMLNLIGSRIPAFVKNELSNINIGHHKPAMNLFDKSNVVQCAHLLAVRITDDCVKGYILNKLLHHGRLYSKEVVPHAGPRVFVHRSISDGTRIRNFDQIKRMLENHGFKSVVMDGMGLSDTKALLRNAQTIVAESGTTTLISSICCPTDALLISLQPDDLLTNASPAMIRSGLPYVLCFKQRVVLFAGKSMRTSSIQSSSLCWFDPFALQRRIC
jgi:hypothetical protein